MLMTVKFKKNYCSINNYLLNNNFNHLIPNVK